MPTFVSKSRTAAMTLAGLAIFATVGPRWALGSRVVVGGIYLDADLINASNSAEFRAYPNTGLYIHNGGTITITINGAPSTSQYGWLSLDVADKESMVNLWSPNGPQSLELGWEADGVGWQNAYTSNYLPEGVVADEVSANVPTGDANGYGSDTDAFAQIPASNISWWTVYVDGFRNLSTGAITNVYPVYAPNEKNKDVNGNAVDAYLKGGPGPNPFASGSFFADVREMALYGGGISVDAPPQQFFNNIGGPGTANQLAYQAIAEGEVAWANANNLHSIWIISPSTSKTLYGSKAQQLVQTLETNATGSQADIPSEYVVENYGVGAAPTYPIMTYNPIGSETDPNSQLGVALWLAGYEQGRSGELQLTPAASGSTHLNVTSQTSTALAGENTTVALSADGLLASTYTVALHNTSTNSADWYIPTLLGTETGEVSDWTVLITLNGRNITSYVLSGSGFTFNSTAIIANAGLVMSAGLTETLSITLTPLDSSAATDPFSLDLTGLAHPDASDPFASVMFVVPEPAMAGVAAVGVMLVTRRRRPRV